jgi:hypothetical protein
VRQAGTCGNRHPEETSAVHTGLPADPPRRAQGSVSSSRRHRAPPDDWDAAREAAGRAGERALQIYGPEMLTPILGCPWDRTFPVSLSTGRAYPRTRDDQPLVTEFPRLLGPPLLVFVRRGAPAPLGPSSAAFVAAPGAVFDDTGHARPWVLKDAALLAQRHGYGSWARADLAPWPETKSALVLVAAGLSADRAPEFGFTALADAASG